jgi:ribosomal protein L37AE/L43A
MIRCKECKCFKIKRTGIARIFTCTACESYIKDAIDFWSEHDFNTLTEDICSHYQSK